MAAMSAAVLLSAVSAGLGAAQGAQQRSMQKKSMREQQEAQVRATNASLQQQRLGDQEAASRAMRNTPDVASLLAAQTRATSAPSLLAGATGVDPAALQLGRTKLLGE